MALPFNLAEIWAKLFKESTSTTGQPGMVVVSPDGSNVGASSADGSTVTAGTTAGSLIEGIYEASPTSIADGKAGIVAIDSTRNLKTNLNVALERTVDDVTSYPAGSTYVNLAADGIVSAVPCVLVGMYVNSTSSGTVKLYDNASAASGTVINNTITPAIGWHDLGKALTTNGVYADFGGTLDATFYTIPTT